MFMILRKRLDDLSRLARTFWKGLTQIGEKNAIR